MKKDIIFLDTNVFGRKEKYDFDHTYKNNILAMLRRYSSIEVFMPSIVKEELRKHIKESVDNDQNNIKSIYVRRKLTQEFYDEAVEENYKKLDEFIERNNIQILDCEKYLQIADVNKWYFNKEKPFERSKPKEFPDAMIISAIVNFLEENKYQNVYVLTEDKGFIESIKSKVDCIVIHKMETILKEFFNFSTYEYKLIEQYLEEKDVLSDMKFIDFESLNVNDTIDLAVDTYDINEYEIIYDQKDDDKQSVVVRINYNALLTGNILLFDPKESIYDEDDEEYIYPMYRAANELEINGLEIYIEIFKNKDGDLYRYKVIEKAVVNLEEYIDSMELYNK